MQVNILIGANAYACIKTESTSMDVRLSPGKSAAVSLIESASEMRAKAAQLLKHAELIMQAADSLASKL